MAFVAAKIYASKLGLVNCASAHARASAVLPRHLPLLSHVIDGQKQDS